MNIEKLENALNEAGYYYREEMYKYDHQDSYTHQETYIEDFIIRFLKENGITQAQTDIVNSVLAISWIYNGNLYFKTYLLED